MRKTFTQFFTVALLLGLGVLPTQAQYLFKDAPDATSNGLGAYVQNFDALAGTKQYFNSNTTLLGVYAKYTLNTGVFAGVEFESNARAGTLAKLAPDDGAEGPNLGTVDIDGTPHGPSWYHFGAVDSTDRALGGIAGTTTSPGRGYVGIRLKNSSTKTIVNLSVMYAMEQWYNSSQTQAATVTVDYQRSNLAITSLTTGTWTSIAELAVPAPSTSTAIAARDGNVATNRRVRQTTLTGLNLLVGEEVMIRFGYVFDSGTNGNGLSVDDIVITPETNVYYSLPANNKDFSKTGSWGTNLDGSGTTPANFTAPNITYYVQGTGDMSDRISGTWTVSGTNSKIVVGTTASATTPAVPAKLYVKPGDNIIGRVDVGPGSTLQLGQMSSSITLGALHPTSTVEYINTGTTMQNVSGGSYGNLVLTGTGPKTLTGSVVVNTGFTFNSTGASALTLGSRNVTLLKGVPLNGLNGSSTLFVTNGTGSLRRTVSSDGVAVVFPVGTTATSYTPVTLSQTLAQSEDAFSVRVANNTYPNYNAAGTGVGAAILLKNVKKTWFVNEEVLGNSNVTMKLQWNNADAVAGFENASAHINHYVNGDWDVYKALLGTTTGTITGSQVATRTGITSFSPFAVSSRPDGALPVELVAFTAGQSAGSVTCNWATATEKDSEYFAVERSANAVQFAEVGRVAAAGNSSSRRDYRFVDAQPLPTTAYYRLRQVDVDGTVAYSPVVAVSGSALAPGALPVVVPNPGTGRFVIVQPDGGPDARPAVVFNSLGAVVRRVAAGTFDLSDQPAGLYLVQVPTSTGTRTLRVIKN